MHTIYTGERTRIRPFRDADEWHYTVSLDCGVPNEHWGPWHCPRAHALKEFEETGLVAPDKYSAMAIERVDTGELVGLEEHGAMHPGKTSTWIGTFVMKEHRKQGFGAEAKQLMLCYLFENFPLSTVIADTTATHRDAKRGLELCGMHFIGARRKAHCYHGKYVDVVLYQIMRADWEAGEYRSKVQRG